MTVFLDLTNSFEKVRRNKFFVKLFHVFEVRGNALPWFSDFLKARIVRVKFNKALSRDFSLSLGVPQGSILDPLLFLMIFANIEKVMSRRFKVEILADDVVFWHSDSDIKAIEADINLNLKM
ncbi:putative RNA-directed DNA polymerase from transposon BS [Caerostris extrusa]|uniref:RNA-directed DNA polymerase from transposon BS n=1 Tax=Caerostris extrusa TaxID=172846 RepID=A0AAV4WUE7_CAEEX|nr:putative RNA-directed DNA polymerase from transposon BS [Caerostris extrusa]